MEKGQSAGSILHMANKEIKTCYLRCAVMQSRSSVPNKIPTIHYYNITFDIQKREVCPTITSEKIISSSPDLNGEGSSHCGHLVSINGQHGNALQCQEVNAVPLSIIKTRTCTGKWFTSMSESQTLKVYVCFFSMFLWSIH